MIEEKECFCDGDETTAVGYYRRAWEDACERLQSAHEDIRDRFAMAAVSGAASAETDGDVTWGDYAAWAYGIADAMLAERAKGTK